MVKHFFARRSFLAASVLWLAGLFVLGSATPIVAQDAGQIGAQALRRSIAQSAPISKAELDALLDKVGATLQQYQTHPPNTRDNDPWEIMHWIIAYGVETQVRFAGPEGDPMTAIGFLCFNGRAEGRRLLAADDDGLQPLRGPGQQGHDGQFLAVLAQSRLQVDYPLQVDDREFTVSDLIEFEKRTCRPKTELTFKLIGLSYYLDSEATWTSETGEDWSISRLVSEEIAQPILGATCGGSHRLMGLSYAVHQRRKENQPVDGQFKRAETYLADYRQYTLSLQNPDGSFSTNWARERGANPSPSTRLYTTGHTLEWMVFSAPDDLLVDSRVARAVEYLCDLVAEPERDWDRGTLGHALHGLSIYQQRASKLAAAAVSL